MKRIEWLDFGKGITIFFVLLGHVFNGLLETKGFEKYNLVSEIFVAIIFTFVMPVFFALSGYLYRRPQNLGSYLKNIKKKFISLFFPYVIFSVVYVILQHFSNSVHKLYSWTSLLNIFSQPISYLWFLYALFFIFAFTGALDLIKVNEYVQLFIYFFLYLLSQFIQLPYFLEATFTWTICFYLGYLLKDRVRLISKWTFLFLLSVIIVFLIFQHSLGGIWYYTNGLTFVTFIPKILSIPVAFFVFANVQKNVVFNYFKKFGQYSLVIYLVHVPVAAVIRILCIKLGILDYFTLVILITLVTWYISIFVSYLSKTHRLFTVVFFPYSFLQGNRCFKA